MKGFGSFRRAFRAELIKLRRTSFWSMALVIFPLIVVVLPSGLALLPGEPPKPEMAGMIAESFVMCWSRLFLPLFTVMAALGMQMNEHTGGTWKHLNAMPTRGAPQVLAKYAVAALAVVAASLALIPFGALSLGAVHLLRSNFTLDGPWPWADLATGWSLSLLTGIAMISVMVALAGRARRGAVGTTLGTCAALTVLGNVFFPGAGYSPWSVGPVWSAIIMHHSRGPSQVTALLLTTPLWLLATILVHVAVEKKRPLY